MKKTLDATIHSKTILGYLGVLIHLPGIMALCVIPIALLFEEFFALIPLLCTTCISLIIGQLLYRVFYSPRMCHLWDAMIIAALAWIVIPVIGSIPYYGLVVGGISRGEFESSILYMSQLPNVLFESFSAFTSTGMSVIDDPQSFPKSFQFWRSFCCWIGGTGLIVFVLSMTQPGSGQFRLYYSEARNDSIGENVRETAKIIAKIYAFYTCIGIIAYYFAGMPFWEAINHSMTSVSTGGFTLLSSSFATYNASIKWIGILLMLIGAISFAIHYKVIQERKFSLLLSDQQQFIFILCIVTGCLGSFLLEFFGMYTLPALDIFFNFVSAITTCGYSASPIAAYVPNTKLILIFAMLLGGCAGSTAGGIKIQRFYDLLEGVYARMRSMTEERERFITAVQSRKTAPKAERFGLPMGPRAERLYAAGILLTMWMVSTFLGWFFMLIAVPEKKALDAFFEVFSAMSNAGLATNVMSADFSTYGKSVYIILMWIGRLEILPAVILLWSILFPFRCKVKEKNAPSR